MCKSVGVSGDEAEDGGRVRESDVDRAGWELALAMSSCALAAPSSSKVSLLAGGPESDRLGGGATIFEVALAQYLTSTVRWWRQPA